jgi:hypothetical protein
MCFFPLFSRPPKRRYSALYSDDELPPRKKRIMRQPETSHSRYETLRGQGVKRSPRSPPKPTEYPEVVVTATTLPLRGHGVRRDPPRVKVERAIPKPKIEREPPKRPVTRNTHRRPSSRNPSRRQTERTTSRHRTVPTEYAPPLFSQIQVEPPIDINYHSSYICNANTQPQYRRDGYAVRAATNHALRGSVYTEPVHQPSRNLRRQPGYGALRYTEVPWQWN